MIKMELKEIIKDLLKLKKSLIGGLSSLVYISLKF